jgi:PAS domain S-box-containing protein
MSVLPNPGKGKSKRGSKDKKRRLVDLVDKKVLTQIQNSYLDYLQSSAAILDAEGNYLLARISSPYCRFLNQTALKKPLSSLKRRELVPKKYLCHHNCYHLSLKAMKTGTSCTEECHGGITVLAVPILVEGEVVGCINAGISNPPADDKAIKRIARNFKIDPQKLSRAALKHTFLPAYLFQSAKKHIVKEAETITEFCKKQILEKHLKEMSLKVEAKERVLGCIHQAEEELAAGIPLEKVLNKVFRGKSLFPDERESITNIAQLLRQAFEKGELERALDEVEERYHNLLESANDGIVVADQDEKIIFFNKKAEKMMGYKASEITGKSIFSIVPQRYQEVEKKNRDSRLKGKSQRTMGETFEANVLRKDGSEIPIEISFGIFKTADVFNFMCIIRDITERKKAEQREKESIDFLQKIIETSPDGIRVTDKRGNPLLINKSLEKITGYSVKELYKMGLKDFVPAEDESLRKAKRIVEDIFERGSASYEISWRKKDGSVVEIGGSSALMKDEQGNVIGGVDIVRDISSRKKAESEINEAMDFLENLIEASVDGIIIMDGIGNILSVNSAVERITGRKKESFIDMHISQFVSLEEGMREEVRTTVAEEYFEKGHASYEFNWQRDDGTLIVAEQISTMVKDEKGNAIAAISIIRDITERRKAERQLKESRDFLENVIEYSMDGIMINDAIGTILSVNKAVEDISGYKREELINQHTSLFIPPDKKIRERVRDEIMPKLFSEGSFAYESVWQKKDGTRLDMELSSAMIKNEEGDYVGGVSIVRDVTEKKTAESELNETRNFLESVIESSMDSILVCDPQGTILSVNTAVETLSGYRREELTGQHVSFLVPKDKRVREELLEKQAHLFEEGFVVMEALWQKKDGSYVEVEQSMSFIKDDEGNNIAAVSIVRDVTEKRSLEHQLLQSQKMETIGTLAGGIAHDFNNILGGILGYASFIKTLVGEESKIYKYVDTIESSAVRAADLTGQLLSFSRGGKYESKPLDVNKIINETLRILYSSIDKSVSIKVALNSLLSSVEGDANQIQQVFLNLFVNARDAMQGGGTLSIETKNVYLDETFCKVHLGAQPGQNVYISVSDTGIGMNQETLHRIFEPFFSTKGREEGTGLGLSVVYGIVKNHGGYINVYSELGKGTVFKIYLPASSKPVLVEGETRISNVEGTESILVIDDEEVIRDFIKEGLEDLGYTVLTAEDGEIGIDIYKEKKEEIKLVVLDLVLPKISGMITYQRLKEIDPQILVLLASGYSQKGQAQELLDQGVQGFMQKPFRLKELAREIRVLLSKGKEYDTN